MGDPNITQLYELLTTELREPSKSDQDNHPTTTCATREQAEPGESHDNAAVLTRSKASKTDIALYVHNMTMELKDICLAADLKFLAYLVDMARVEANNIVAQKTENRAESATPTHENWA